MIYTFLHFKIDTDSQELFLKNKAVDISKQHYDLLLLFVENQNSVFSKDDLIERVWKGRYVAENTIDQSISKLRKVLKSDQNNDYIKTVYGKGFKFVPTVKQVTKKEQKNNKKLYLIAPIILFLVLSLYLTNQKTTKEIPSSSLLLIMSDANASSKDAWLSQASVKFVEQVFGYTNASSLKHINDKPQHQDRKQYIENQWRISPDLKLVTTTTTHKNNIYTITLNISDKFKQLKAQTFSNQNLSLAMKQASSWLATEVGKAKAIEKIDSFIPNDSYVFELYMRGLASHSKGEIDKAEHFFQLCLEEKPDFYLARLQLANVLSNQGKQEKSLAMLDTLKNTEIFTQLEIEVENLRADIYDTQGRYNDAKKIYSALIEKYKDDNLPQLNDVRLNLSYTYAVLTEFEKALTLLNTLESSVSENENPELLAHVYQKKASLLQKIGQTQHAKVAAEKSLSLFSKLQDLLGEAKTLITLARISTHQTKFNESIRYLEQSLLINQKVNYKLGVGATLNELIYVLMVQGQFTKALQLNKEMQSIAIEIDYTAMLQISKQYLVDVYRFKKDFIKAEIYLQEHLQLAQASDNKRALLKNKLLSLDLFIDQGSTNRIITLIEQVQSYIEESGERRLQPRINVHLAKYYFLVDNPQQAIGLLLSSKKLAQDTEDGETLVEINNLIAEHYIKNNQAQKALAILEESFSFKPLPYPYLLLKSKANNQLGNILKALDYASECKQGAYEWWVLEDERYLKSLSKTN